MDQSADLNEADVIYDWNIRGDVCSPPLRRVQFVDETLRDGVQSPSVTDAQIEAKIKNRPIAGSGGRQSCGCGIAGGWAPCGS